MEKILKVISLEDATSEAWEITDDFGQMFCHIVATYTPCLYGKRQITKWLVNNKGIGMITMSNLALVASLIKNNFEYWPEQYKIKKMTKEQQQHYKEENQLKKPKFTDRAGQSRALYSCGWSKEGLDFYYETLDKWKRVGGRKESWEMLELYWQTYSRETGFDNQWKKRKNCAKKTLIVPAEEEPRARFSLPGTEGFDDVFSWKKNPRRVSDENDRERSSSASSLKSAEESDVNEEDNCNSDEEKSSDDEEPRSNKKPKLGGFEDEDSDEY